MTFVKEISLRSLLRHSAQEKASWTRRGGHALEPAQESAGACNVAPIGLVLR